MKDLRTALLPGNIKLRDGRGIVRGFEIIREIGRGSSLIAYDASYMSSDGDPIRVTIKECYPYASGIARDDAGSLIADEEQTPKLDIAKEKVRRSFSLHAKLYGGDASNDVTIPDDILTGNGTIYLVTRPMKGRVISLSEGYSFNDIVKMVLSTARTVDKIHDSGYLCLDIKPSNLYVIDSHPDLVQFFDFDSMIPLENEDRGDASINVSYTRGFAPIEQQTGDMKRIGKWSDVYSAGALLYSLIYKKTPTVFDCENGAVYDLSGTFLGNGNYSDKALRLLKEILGKSLPSYYRDRYPDMKELISDLEELERLSDEKKIFVSSPYIPKPGFFTGRENELKQISDWIDLSDSKCLYITGMGGIGKSTLVRKALADNEEKLDDVIFLWFDENLKHTICSDSMLFINTVSKDPGEKEEDYFYRKVNVLKDAFNGKNTLMVIDNFTGDTGKDFAHLIGGDIRVILVTRDTETDERFPRIDMGPIEGDGSIRELIEKHSDTILREDEPLIKTFVEKTYGNTLLMELLAKKMRNDGLSLPEIIDLLDRLSPSKVEDGSVRMRRDEEVLRDTVGKLITGIFATDNMTSDERDTLKMIAVFASPILPLKDTARLIHGSSDEHFMNLSSKGWITVKQDEIEIHPLIRECVLTEQWNRSSVRCFLYSGKTLLQILSGDVKEEVESPGDYSVSWMQSVMSIKDREGNEIRDALIPDLGYKTIKSIPRDREEDILSIASYVKDTYKEIGEVMYMDFIESIVDIYVREEQYEEANQTLEEAKRYAEEIGTDFSMARYYDGLGWYYDARTESYCEDDEYTDKMIEAVELSIYHIEKAKSDPARRYLAKYIVDKVNVLMRLESIKPKEASKLLKRSDDLLSSLPEDDRDVKTERFRWFMVSARFYTIIKPDRKSLFRLLDSARTIAEEISDSAVFLIEEFFIPAANYMLDIGEFNRSRDLLNEAVSLCDEKKDIQLYQNKKNGLLGYIEDVDQRERE